MKINPNNLMDAYGDVSSSKYQSKEVEDFKNILDAAQKSDDKEQIKKVAAEFEAFFLKNIFKTMRQSSEDNDGLFEKSEATKMYEQMMDEHMSKHISEGRGIGLGQQLYKQMLRQYGYTMDASNPAADEVAAVVNENPSTDNHEKIDTKDNLLNKNAKIKIDGLY